MAFQYGSFQLGAFQIVSGVSSNRKKKKLDLTEYNRHVLSKMLSEEAEKIEPVEPKRKQETKLVQPMPKLGIFEPVAALEAAMPRVVDNLTAKGAEDVIPMLLIVYGEMLKKAKAEAQEADDVEVLLLAA